MTTDSLLEIDNPDLEDAILELIIGEVAKIRTITPARVLEVTGDRVTCQPILRGRYVDEDAQELKTVKPPVLSNVPVWRPGGLSAVLHFPLQAGDEVILLCSDRSLAEWKQSTQDDLTPQDMRRFSLMDAVALPGLKSLTQSLLSKTFFGEPSTAGARFVVDGGKVALGAGGVEALEQIHSALDEIKSTITELNAVTLAIEAAATANPATPLTTGLLASFWIAGGAGLTSAVLTARLLQLTTRLNALNALRGSL